MNGDKVVANRNSLWYAIFAMRIDRYVLQIGSDYDKLWFIMRTNEFVLQTGVFLSKLQWTDNIPTAPVG
jgi:hypothetical protein